VSKLCLNEHMAKNDDKGRIADLETEVRILKDDLKALRMEMSTTSVCQNVGPLPALPLPEARR